MYDLGTITMYGVAAMLSFSLSLVLLAVAHFRQGTVLCRPVAIAIMVASAGFFLAGYGPQLPVWATVIGTNVLILAPLPLFHTGFTAYAAGRPARVDRVGWAIVLATIPAFAYWGLVEPDGIRRSVAFSVAAAALGGHTASTLALAAQVPGQRDHRALQVIAAIFALLTVAMLFRIGVLWHIAPLDIRGGNPTTWHSIVLGITLMAGLVVVTLLLELPRLAGDVHDNPEAGAFASLRGRLAVLWAMVATLMVSLFGVIGIALSAYHDSEQARLIDTAELANNAFSEYTVQVIGQADTALHAVRGFHYRTQSFDDTEHFIGALGFDRTVINNIYLVDREGHLRINLPGGQPVKVSDREYFAAHRDRPDDELFFSRVDTGRVTGKLHFRISRRLDNPDGSFGGLVIATIDQEALSQYFRRLIGETDAIAGLVGTGDHLLRVRWPGVASDWWSRPIESPIWAALEQSSKGTYKNVSKVDGTARTFVYQRLGRLPLVMTTGFSEAELMRGMMERIRWPAATAGVVLVVIVVLAMLLTIEIRRRDEQERFMAMLSHEIKTPLSVIRLSLGMVEGPAAIRQHILNAVADMSAIVERTVLSDRVQQGRQTYFPERCEISTLLAQVVRESAAPDRVAMQLSDSLVANTDPLLLKTIVANLVDNALKYSPSGATVTLVAEPVARDGKPALRLSVSNPVGPAGMPDRRRAFERYYRSPAARSKSGSGLGLYIAEGLARRLGGHLALRPEGDTVKFVLWMPL